ncbi:MAG: BMP family ABC transporter substrate-binding protein, partial [Actinomycetota bacterium]|nr:BMP family ABC transporter substrate-binding protein [Actinomycetota bacterium]
YDLKVDGVGYSTSGGFVDDIGDQLEEIKAAIIAGEIEVPTAP